MSRRGGSTARQSEMRRRSLSSGARRRLRRQRRRLSGTRPRRRSPRCGCGSRGRSSPRREQMTSASARCLSGRPPSRLWKSGRPRTARSAARCSIDCGKCRGPRLHQKRRLSARPPSVVPPRTESFLGPPIGAAGRSRSRRATTTRLIPRPLRPRRLARALQLQATSTPSPLSRGGSGCGSSQSL